MQKLMNIFFLSCLKATELIEKKMHFKLSRMEKIQLKVHKMMCSACPQYEKQSAFIEKGIAAVHNRKFTETDLEQLKNLITQKLENTK